MRSGGGESVFNPFVFGNKWVQSMHTSIFFAQNVPNLKGSFFKWVQLTLAFFFCKSTPDDIYHKIYFVLSYTVHKL